jgi:hypothetical protein
MIARLIGSYPPVRVHVGSAGQPRIRLLRRRRPLPGQRFPAPACAAVRYRRTDPGEPDLGMSRSRLMPLVLFVTAGQADSQAAYAPVSLAPQWVRSPDPSVGQVATMGWGGGGYPGQNSGFDRMTESYVRAAASHYGQVYVADQMAQAHGAREQTERAAQLAATAAAQREAAYRAATGSFKAPQASPRPQRPSSAASQSFKAEQRTVKSNPYEGPPGSYPFVGEQINPVRPPREPLYFTSIVIAVFWLAVAALIVGFFIDPPH